MNFYSSWFSSGLMWAANLALLLLLLPLAPAAWRSISRHHAATAAALLILALWWSLRAQIGGGQIGGMKKVMGTSNATAIVADRPGTAPTNNP